MKMDQNQVFNLKRKTLKEDRMSTNFWRVQIYVILDWALNGVSKGSIGFKEYNSNIWGQDKREWCVLPQHIFGIMGKGRILRL